MTQFASAAAFGLGRLRVKQGGRSVVIAHLNRAAVLANSRRNARRKNPELAKLKHDIANLRWLLMMQLEAPTVSAEKLAAVVLARIDMINGAI